nr:hypothetical protein [Tanacetum cinerariifolium]
MYCLVVTDDYSRFTWVFFLATKDETSGILKSFITRIENLVDHKVMMIRCDNGIEFKNREMNQFCEIKEAVNTACYVQNRVLVVKPHNKTQYELFYSRTPTLSFMRPFGCPVTILNTIDHLGKFDNKADECFFVGYSLNSKAFRVFNSRKKIVKENLHIRFSENTPNVVGSRPDWLFDIDALTRTMNYKPIVAEKEDNVNNTNNVNTVSPTVNDAGTNRVNAVGELLFDPDMPALEDVGTFNFSNEDEDDDAVTDMNNLDTTIQEELLQFKLQELWTLVDLPNRKRAIGTKWIFKNKKDERGIVIRNKARLIAQGHTQEEGVDYDEVFAHVARIEAIRLFLAYASFKDFVVYQMDVKSAFLYEKTKQELYVCQPPGFEDPNFLDRVYKVKKALYGLHQALEHGLQVKQEKDGIFISQDKYVVEILKKFEFTEVKNASTPMETQKPLLKDKDGEEVDVHMYRYQVNLNVSHLHAVKRIFRYLKGQPKLGLWYPKDSSFDLVAYIDSDYAGERLDKKSTTGEQFWSTTVAKTINVEAQIRDRVDGKKLIISEASIRRDLKLADEEGVDCLPNSTIFEQLASMGRIGDIDADKDITLVNDQADAEMFDADKDLGGEEDKGKGIIVEEPVKHKKKEQIRLDEEAALKFQAEYDEEQRLAREKAKKELEANIALIETWDDVQAEIDVDHQLAERLQAEEKQESTDEEKATLFMKFLEKRRKFFAAKRAEEKRNKPPTQAQKRKIMCTYPKNIEGYTLKQLKEFKFDKVQEMFDKAFKRVNIFEDFRTVLVQGQEKEKRAGEELIQKRAKKQKHMMVLLTSEAEYMMLTVELKDDTCLKGLSRESRFELGLVAGIAISALPKVIRGPKF